MKRLIIGGLVWLLGLTASRSLAQNTDDALTAYYRGSLEAFELDIEASGAEYAGILDRTPARGNARKELSEILSAGKRNLNWIDVLNRSRGNASKLSLSSAKTMGGYPITAPKIYNIEKVKLQYSNLKNQMPTALSQVIFGQQPLPTQLPTDEATYILWGRAMDGVYQTAARLVTMEPNMTYLTAMKDKDLRGFYKLSQDPNTKSKLRGWKQLDAATQNSIKDSLTQMCRNNGAFGCDKAVSEAISKNDLDTLYQKYLPGSQRLWNSYFSLDVKRNDVNWSEKNQTMTVPFQLPSDVQVQNYVKGNIEDEWRWGTWRLIIDFVQTSFSSVPHIVFAPNATPHVNSLGGNEITMDSNAPLSEYDVQWTIRHEYGHVLGFKDCYLEFYDSGEKALVSYQLDITNIMCSRKGRLKEIHYQQLKRLYKGN